MSDQVVPVTTNPALIVSVLRCEEGITSCSFVDKQLYCIPLS